MRTKKGNLPNIKLASRAILARATQKIRTEAIKKAPYDTGILRKSINSRVTATTGRVGVDKNVPYARIQEFGGVIRPKNKKLLSWKKNGKWFFAKKVTIKPQPYLLPAFGHVRDELGGIIDAEISKTTL